MSTPSEGASQPQSIRSLVEGWHADDDRETLIAALVAREDNMADLLRMAGVQFGLYAEIVSEVLAQIGLGTAPTEEERAFIRQQFINLMNRLRQEHQGRSDSEGN